MSESIRISLKAARVNAGLTMEDVCKCLKVSKNTILNWEKGYTLPDADKAVHLLEQASAEVPKAHYVLGKMHELGDGIPRDDDEAIREYELFIESMKDRLGADT